MMDLLIMLHSNLFLPECRKEMKTVKAERTVHKIHETCFSIKPVPKCVGACAEPTESKVSIALHCLPSKDADVHLQKWKRGEILDEMESKEVHWHKDFKVPEICLPAKPSVTN